ncbi:cytochrome P450 monooxygenase (lovA) [Fusarium mexicanum]|uniref:Cytochrome P450 monooxygenase (LovA) n=1 Tax=Fusarium mexicanum TaxID=751941 RepID=A0A8H5INE9_9HYPO|nr:cytochrome P450 monooxygenase (lovA) [Fusarium mexicanum]
MGFVQHFTSQAADLQHVPFYYGIALLLALTYGIYRMVRPKTRHRLPVFKLRDNNVLAVLTEAYKQYPTSPFMLELPGMEMAVLPPADVDTIRGLPESVVSIKKHHYDVFLGEYTYMGTKSDEFDSAMRNVLTRNTPAVLESFTEEVEYAISNTIGPCKDWTPVVARKAMCRVASLMSGRAFVGLPLSRDPDWVEANVNYTADVSKAWMILKMIPQPIRFFVAPFLPHVRSLKRQRKNNEAKLAPVLGEKQSSSPTPANKEKPVGGNLLDWFISQYKTTPTAQELGRDQLLATFASIYNLSNALTYIAFDLAATPEEDVEEMRKELFQVLGEDGVIDKNSLAKLKKLDSFAKESQRLCPPSLVNIPRIVTSPEGLKTSTGDVLPMGTRMTIMSHFINHDPKVYPEPEKFKPFRFSALREVPGNETKYQHASTGLDNINFGHGIWACPGRFFASAQIKVVLAHLLMNYDVKLRKGADKPGQIHYGLAILPDAQAEIMFKSRK